MNETHAFTPASNYNQSPDELAKRCAILIPTTKRNFFAITWVLRLIQGQKFSPSRGPLNKDPIFAQ